MIVCILESAKSLREVKAVFAVGMIVGGGVWIAFFAMIESLVECAAAHFVDMRSLTCMRSILGREVLVASIVILVVGLLMGGGC